MADRTGLEPATSGVTGRHSNQLNYRSEIWWVMRDLNSRHSPCKGDALPTELITHCSRARHSILIADDFLLLFNKNIKKLSFNPIKPLLWLNLPDFYTENSPRLNNRLKNRFISWPTASTAGIVTSVVTVEKTSPQDKARAMGETKPSRPPQP